MEPDDDRLSLTDMPPEVLREIVENLDIESTMRLCKRRQFYEFCRANPGILEAKARREVEQVAPYSRVCNNYLQTWRLIRDGQFTGYVYINDPPMNPGFPAGYTALVLARRTVEENTRSDDTIIFFPGLMVVPGRYIMVGSFESSEFPMLLVKTEEEVYTYITSLAEGSENSDHAQEFLDLYQAAGGLQGGNFEATVGPEDGDQLRVIVTRTVVMPHQN